jgi:hypothetical protein
MWKNFFWQYRTVKLKIPRKCCPWCEFYLEQINQNLKELKEKINELEARSTVDHSIQLTRLKLETNSLVFGQLIKSYAGAPIGKAEFTYWIELYTHILEVSDTIISRLDSQLQDSGRRNHESSGSSSVRTSPSLGHNGHTPRALPSHTEH